MFVFEIEICLTNFLQKRSPETLPGTGLRFSFSAIFRTTHSTTTREFQNGFLRNSHATANSDGWELTISDHSLDRPDAHSKRLRRGSFVEEQVVHRVAE